MAAPSQRWRGVTRAGQIEYDRILFFSDAIFAIAITLLIVGLRVPDSGHVQSGRLLRNALPQIGGFGLSFAAIGLFWIAHHNLFRYIKGMDRRLVLLNLLVLGCIAFLPYPTALLSRAGNQVPATIFYAASVAAAGLAEAAVWLYAIRIRALALPGVHRPVRRSVLLRILRLPAVFLLSIPLAIVQPTLAKYLWLLVFVTGFALRRLEPAEDEPQAAPGVDRAG
ncbi:MAG TPA: TMEM175 family protein [Actinomycetes bacterium]